MKKENICSFNLEEQTDSMIKLFMERDILGKYFQAVKESSLTTCIECKDIFCRCVFILSMEDEVMTMSLQF